MSAGWPASLEAAKLPEGARFEADEFGDPRVVARRDLTHLEADALSDRLAAWVARRVRRLLPGATAAVGFENASPATDDEPEADFEAVWRDVEARFTLHLEHPPASEADARAFLDLVPEFLAVVDAAGRPSGWRDPLEGAVE